MRVVAIAICLFSAIANAQLLEVNVDLGRVRGKVETTPLGDVTSFKGIPYAAPPVGKLRFQRPMTHEGWTGSLDASNYRANCPQKKEDLANFSGFAANELDNLQFDEDCLHLNVLIPGTGVKAGGSLPVMVWLHGGRFKYSSAQIMGSTSKEAPHALVVKGNVILVSVNYRLNVFGFFTLGGDTMSANLGIKDQTMALKWIHKNIASFGGDPYRVTLFGDEKGGSSVQMHMFSEYSHGLFKRAAISSGAMTGWATPTNHEAAMIWYNYADRVGCRSLAMNKTEIVMCLQTKSTKELLDKLNGMEPTLVIDGYMLKDQPANLLKYGNFNAVELIIGCNNLDGDALFFNKPNAVDVYDSGVPGEWLEHYMDLLANIGYPKSNTAIGRDMHMLMGEIYFSNKSDPEQNLQDVAKLGRDAFFFAPAMKLAFMNMEAGRPTYFYFFEHSSPTSTRRHQGSALNGAGVGTEVWYILGDVNAGPGVDRDLMNSVIKAWSTFAASGKPEYIDATNTIVPWPRFDDWLTRVGFNPPLEAADIARWVPKGPLYFNKLFPLALKAMSEMKPKPDDDHKSEPDVEPEKPNGEPEEPNGETEKPYGEPDGEPKMMMAVMSAVMLALICLLVVLSVAMFGLLCKIHGASKRHSVAEKYIAA